METRGAIMITYHNMGRLGNNLFQYAFAQALAISKGFKLVIPEQISGLRLACADGHAFDGEAIEINALNLDLIQLPFQRRRYHLNGFFQKTKYYDFKKCREWIQFEQPVVKRPDCDLIVHVRLGDYLEVGSYLATDGGDYSEGWFVGRRYYELALAMFPKSRYCRYAMSDDVNHPIFKELCRVHELIPLPSGDRIVDLWTMASFDNLVIPNSTYGWWGGVLSGSNQIVYPHNVHPWPLDDRIDLRVKEWVMVDLKGKR